jgi:hypothetical protein
MDLIENEMYKKIAKIDNLVVVLFFLIFLGDVYNSFFGGRYFNITHLFKGLFFLISLYLFWGNRFETKRIIPTLMGLGISFSISYVLEFYNSGLNQRDLYLNVVLIFKYLLVVFVFFTVKGLHISIKYIKIFLNIVFLLVSFVSIIVFVFQIDAFLTYGGTRFGYKALLASQNEASFFYLIGICYFFFLYKMHKRYIFLVCLGVLLFASIILGTKAALLGVVIFLLYACIYLYKRGIRYIPLIAFIGSLVIISILFGYGFFDFYISLAKDEGIWYMITSKRNTYLIERLPNILSDWEWHNYLFGELKHEKNLLEMDIIDLFLFFGIVGCSLYYYILFSTVFNIKNKDRLGFVIIVIFFLVGGLAGHIFASGINALYLALVMYCIQYSESNFIPHRV